MTAKTLSPELLHKMDAYWRATIRHRSIDILCDFEALHGSGFIDGEYPDQVLQDVGNHFLEFIAPSLETSD